MLQRTCFRPFIDTGGGNAPSLSFSGSSKSSPAPATATLFKHFLRFSICCEGIPQGSINVEKDSSIRVKKGESVRGGGREGEVRREGRGRERERE